VQPRRRFGREQLPVIGQDGLHRAEYAVAHQLVDDIHVRQEAGPHRLDEHPAGRRGGGRHLPGLAGVEGEGLLHEHMLAGRQREQGVLVVLARR